jgi:hypothetical protein
VESELHQRLHENLEQELADALSQKFKHRKKRMKDFAPTRFSNPTRRRS